MVEEVGEEDGFLGGKEEVESGEVVVVVGMEEEMEEKVVEELVEMEGGRVAGQSLKPKPKRVQV